MHLSGARRLALLLVVALSLIGSMVYASQSQAMDAVQVAVDGRVIGLASDAASVDAALRALAQAAERQHGLPVQIANPPDVIAVRVPREQPLLDVAGLVAALRPVVRFASDAVAIRVNGRDVVYLPSRDDAQAVLDAIRERFRPRPADGQSVKSVKVQEISFVERVDLVPVRVAPARVGTVDEAVRRLLWGGQQVRTYRVRPGESLWTIARRTGLPVRTLLAANPRLDPERLQQGQVIRLVAPQPYLRVRTVEERVLNDPIPFTTRTVYDASLPAGQQRVRQEGVPGRLETVDRVVRVNGVAVSRTVLRRTVVQAPQERVVVRGTRRPTLVAFGFGGGFFRWPLRGLLTSYFGWRDGGFHTGIDIAAPPGTPVYAAASGRVVQAGWDGSYGRTVTIDHGGGRQTRYAHLSRIWVGVGEYVNAGEGIGAVGCSGRCTGPHLHFEILIGGRPVNPLRYLP